MEAIWRSRLAGAYSGESAQARAWATLDQAGAGRREAARQARGDATGATGDQGHPAFQREQRGGARPW